MLIDPYRSGALGGRISHGPIDSTPDIVVVTHYHEDHGWHGAIRGNPVIVDEPAIVQGIEFRMVTVPHDCQYGSHMGLSRMVSFEIDGINVLHPGDLGRLPTSEEVEALGIIDLLLLPVGGTYTIELADAFALHQLLEPRWTVPMHYRSSKVDLEMHSRDAFLDTIEGRLRIENHENSELNCSAAELGESSTVVLLQPRL